MNEKVEKESDPGTTTCPHCATKYEVDWAEFPPVKLLMQCAVCSERFYVAKPGTASPLAGPCD